MKRLRNLLVVAVAFAVIAGLVGCASVPRNDSLVGHWRGSDGDIIVNADGSALLHGQEYIWRSTDTVVTFSMKVSFTTTDMYKWPYEVNGDTLILNANEYKKIK